MGAYNPAWDEPEFFFRYEFFAKDYQPLPGALECLRRHVVVPTRDWLLVENSWCETCGGHDEVQCPECRWCYSPYGFDDEVEKLVQHSRA